MDLDYMLPIMTYPEPAAEAGLGAAVELVAKFARKLSIVVQTVDIPPLNNVIAEALIDVSAMADDAERQSRDRGAALARVAADTAAEVSIASSSETLVTSPATALDTLAAAARLHDGTVFVLDHELKSHVEAAKAILFGSGGPLLLCPAKEREPHLRSALIAWDGSRAAARAVRDAVPILKAAHSVTVLTASEDKPIDSDSVDGVRRFLEGHGIETGRREIRLGGDSVGRSLQEEAAYSGGGLLVMGGYGHSRLRELVLGGATASLLREGPLLPVFMSH